MTSQTRHVVLGGTGVVGRETISALLALDLSVTGVSRSGREVLGAAPVSADLLDPQSVARAVESADVAYLTVGLPYTLSAWRDQWPIVLQNAVDACLQNGTHLVYFDNVYAYGQAHQPMTEATPVRPSSKKGKVRAALLAQLESSATERGLLYTVGRSADFYGPGASTSVFNLFALDKVRDGKQPTWLFDARQPHSMTYTPDIGKALAVLGTDPRAKGRVWHVPTAPALTGEQYMTLATHGAAHHRTMRPGMMRLGALFSSAARESLEMAYQNTQPYLFDSSAFEREFGLNPTPYADGIEDSLRADRSGSSDS